MSGVYREGKVCIVYSVYQMKGTFTNADFFDKGGYNNCIQDLLNNKCAAPGVLMGENHLMELSETSREHVTYISCKIVWWRTTSRNISSETI